MKRDGTRRPRILFLADRNILADQAFNAFSAFDKDALIRINPFDIRRTGGVPMSGSVYFTIFQTFMSGYNGLGKDLIRKQINRDHFNNVLESLKLHI